MIKNQIQEKVVWHMNAWVAICLFIFAAAFYFVLSTLVPDLMTFFPIVSFVLMLFCCSGLVINKPNEARVYTLFGRYAGSLKKEGFYFVNPFFRNISLAMSLEKERRPLVSPLFRNISLGGTISLKTMTLQNGKQKINDELGNPIEVGIVVIWRIVDTAKSVFGVENYAEFLSTQADSCLRRIISMYPYDSSLGGARGKTLRGSNDEISEKLKQEIQQKVNLAGIEILEAKITHLAYAPEIALAMLQRQQAAAVIDARKLIVEGAVSMVEMALKEITKNNMVKLDDTQKAQMISNLLVVLCSNKDVQPVVSNGTTVD